MPRIVNEFTNHHKKWNMYVNEIDKAQYLLALSKNGKSYCQSAAVRAFMYLYVNDIEVQNKINKIVDNYVVHTDNGKMSIL